MILPEGRDMRFGVEGNIRYELYTICVSFGIAIRVFKICCKTDYKRYSRRNGNIRFAARIAKRAIYSSE